MDTKETRQIRAQNLQEGIQKHFAKVKTITFGGKDHKTAEIVSALQGAIDAQKESAARKAAYHEAVEAENAALDALQPVALGLRTYIYLTFGNGSAKLADFGLAPRTRRAPDVETKADAVDKRRATRKARGTLGKRQREEIVAEPEAATAGDGSTEASAPATTSATAPAVAKPATPST